MTMEFAPVVNTIEDLLVFKDENSQPVYYDPAHGICCIDKKDKSIC